MGIELGIFGLLVLILDIWAGIKILGSGASTVAKIIWILLILFLPVVGLIIWFLFGPKS